MAECLSSHGHTQPRHFVQSGSRSRSIVRHCRMDLAALCPCDMAVPRAVPFVIPGQSESGQRRQSHRGSDAHICFGDLADRRGTWGSARTRSNVRWELPDLPTELRIGRLQDRM